MSGSREVVLEILCPYLAPRELYNVSQVSKRVRSFLTRSLVLESILYHGEKSSVQLIKEIMELVRAGKIHTPSAVRLLRLAAAKRCEIRNSHCYDRVMFNGSHLEYGVFCCKSCTQSSTSHFKHRTKRDMAIVGPALKSPLTCMWLGGVDAYMWTKPLKSRDGECVGPLITVELMKRLRFENPQLSLQESFDKYVRESQVINETGLEISEGRKTLVQIFDRIEVDAKKYRERTQKRKCDEKDQRALAKRAKAESVEERLAALIGSLGVGREIWSSSEIYKKVVEPFRKAPSKATKKALLEAAETIKGYFGHVPADFLEFKFLDQMKGEFPRCLKIAMKEVGSRFFTTICPYQLALIKLGRNMEALIFFQIPFKVFQEYAKDKSRIETKAANVIWDHHSNLVINSFKSNIVKSRSSWGFRDVEMNIAMEEVKRNLSFMEDSSFSSSLEDVLEKASKQLEEAHPFIENLLTFEWYNDSMQGYNESVKQFHLENWVDYYRNLWWREGCGVEEYLLNKPLSDVFSPINWKRHWDWR